MTLNEQDLIELTLKYYSGNARFTQLENAVQRVRKERAQHDPNRNCHQPTPKRT